MASLDPLGDRAFLARFDSEAEAACWGQAARVAAGTNLIDIVVAYRSVAVFADPDKTDFDGLEARLRNLEPVPLEDGPGELVSIPVLYDGEDLGEVARTLGMTEAEVVAAHTGDEYRVFAVGFLPGFPYAGYLPAVLSGLPRRASPRIRVPAGSVAIAGRQTGIYPRESPGGWHLLGRTPLRIVDVDSGHFPIRAGDRLRFVPIDEREFQLRQGERL